MNQNERRLALLLMSLLFGWGLLVGIETFILEPLGARRSRLASLAVEQQQGGQQQRQLQDAERVISAASPRSVATDEALAVTRLQSWLIALGHKVKLNECVVTPLGSRTLEPGIRLLPLHLEATGKLSDLILFVRQIESADVLCRVTSLLLESDRDYQRGQARQRMTFEFETLLIEHSESSPRSWPPTPSSKSGGSAGDWDSQSLATLDRLRFSPTVVAPATPLQRSTPNIPVREPVTTYLLIGSVQAGGRREAWFYDTDQQRRFVVTEGSELADSRMTVASIHSTHVELRGDQSTTRLELGKQWSTDQTARD